jgi:hypothetical protein
MKTTFRKFAVVLATALIGTFLTATANAGCGNLQQIKPGASLHRQSWQGQGDFASGSLQLIADYGDDPIVGLWRVTFTAKGNVGPGLPPDGTVIDNAFVQWHNDGTEIMNSSRNPATQSFCLGVWKKLGLLRYKLNHFAISWDPNTDPNNPLGPANVRENVILSSDGSTFAGTFVIVQYNSAGKVLVRIKGLLSATRITPDTAARSLFQN